MAEKTVYIRKSGEMFVIKYDTAEEHKALETLLSLAQNQESVLNQGEISRIINILGLAPTERNP